MILKDILTGEQIDMLKRNSAHRSLFTLFLMNEEEKHNFFRNYRSTWLARYDSYLATFNALYDKYCEYKSSDSFEKSVCFCFCDRLYSFSVYMQHCVDLVRIYDILLDFI